MTYHEEYRKLWIEAGYPEDMGSAAAVKPPPKEYRAAYHFTEFEHASSDIVNAWIKVTRISEANDPFEFHGFKATRGLLPEMRRLKEDANTKLRLLCFSQDWRSPALWAHYAKRHTGVCLGFWAIRSTLHDVTYHIDRIDAGFGANARIAVSEEMREVLFTAKAQDWRYEEEIRRCLRVEETFESGGNQFFRFDDSLRLSEVILGEKCTEQQLHDVRVLVQQKYKTVTVYKARSATGFFKMVPYERTIP